MLGAQNIVVEISARAEDIGVEVRFHTSPPRLIAAAPQGVMLGRSYRGLVQERLEKAH